MIKRMLFLCFYLLVGSSLLFAGTTGKIAGKVVDSENGDPLPGVNVLIENTHLGSATVLDGSYFIINVPPGAYDVTASMMGYKKVTKLRVRVNIDQTTTLDFSLQPETIAGEVVTIVAERPAVELDLTASKETIGSEEIEIIPIRNVKDAMSIQSGVSINKAVRGTFGNDILYLVDGMEIRDIGSNLNYEGVNTSAIQEMEILTGGYNAEYGRARGAIINIVTKAPSNKITGSIQYKMRPAGVYHFGRNIYSKDNYEWKVMATREYWDPNSTYKDWDGEVKPGNDGGAFWADKTPEERLAAWKRWINGEATPQLDVHDLLYNYDKRTQWELEGTVAGAITDKIRFMLSGRFLEGVPKLPGFLKYNPDWNYQGKLYYEFKPGTRLILSAMYGGYENSGLSRTGYYTTENSQFGTRAAEAGFRSAYDGLKYWPYGTPHLSYRSPEYNDTYNAQIKFVHSLSEKSFIEINLSHTDITNIEDFHDVQRFTWDQTLNMAEVVPQNNMFQPLSDETNKGDLYRRNHWTRETTLKMDYVSQITKAHQIKAGAIFSYEYYKSRYQWGWLRHLSTDYAAYPEGGSFNPYEGGLYVQDKIETKGMIINLGLRTDFFALNKKVSDTIWDPMRIGLNTPGHTSDVLNVSMSPDSPYAIKPDWKWAISPRIGISHPLTENSVLHFMYGHFNQRPSWTKIGASPAIWAAYEDPVRFPDYLKPYADWFPAEGDVRYRPWDTYSNPGLGYEKTIQYEVGLDHNFENLFSLDATLYYKDGKGLTSVGQLSRGSSITQDYGTDASRLATRLYPDPDNPTAAAGMGNFWVPVNAGYLDSRGLEATIETQYTQYMNVSLVYNMSYTYTSRYGYSRMYFDPEGEAEPYAPNLHYGLSNSDNGISGNNNDRWNPANTLKMIGTFRSPVDFGPALGSFHVLGDWMLNWYTVYSSGQKYTYHPPGSVSTEVNNKTWDPRWETNIRVAKKLTIFGNVSGEFSVDVFNLFDNRLLRPLSGDALEAYEEQGILPRHSLTREEDQWTIYDYNLMPREIIFGFRVAF